MKKYPDNQESQLVRDSIALL